MNMDSENIENKENSDNSRHEDAKEYAGSSAPVVDVHMHCLYGVDDGAKTPEMSMGMIRSSYSQGVRTIMCTSHDSAYDYYSGDARAVFKELRSRCAAEMGDLKLFLGCEIYAEPAYMESILQDLEGGKYPSMNGTKFVLIEFPTYGINFKQARHCVEELQKAGWQPVIAHCERYYRIFSGISNVKELKDMGCLIQINAYSLTEETGENTRGFANKIIDNRLVDVIGSDAHRTDFRPPRISNGVKEIYRRFDKEYADAICYKNAEKYFELK